MRKLILVAVAGYVWKKFRDRNHSHTAYAGSSEAGSAALPKRRVDRTPAANHKTTTLEGSTT
jgi:hypothetical protein